METINPGEQTKSEITMEMERLVEAAKEVGASLALLEKKLVMILRQETPDRDALKEEGYIGTELGSEIHSAADTIYSHNGKIHSIVNRLGI